jgi:hypothetical protein
MSVRSIEDWVEVLKAARLLGRRRCDTQPGGLPKQGRRVKETPK